MGVNVKIESGGIQFELALEEQHSILFRNDVEIADKLVEFVSRVTKAVHVEVSNGFGVELLDISKFDSMSNWCTRSLQKKYFGASDEGRDRFELFRVSTTPKDKERYQRMLEGYWKAYTEEKRDSDGGKIFFVVADNFLKEPEFRALYRSDRINYYVLLTKGDLRKFGYEEEVIYELETEENVSRLKRTER